MPFLCLFSGRLSFTACPTLFTFLLGRSSRTGLQASQGAEEALVCVKFALRRQRMDEDIREKAESSPLLPAQGAWPVHDMHTRAGTRTHTARPGPHTLVLAASACRPLLSRSQFSPVTHRLESVFAQPLSALSSFFSGQSWFWP